MEQNADSVRNGTDESYEDFIARGGDPDDWCDPDCAHNDDPDDPERAWDDYEDISWKFDGEQNDGGEHDEFS